MTKTAIKRAVDEAYRKIEYAAGTDRTASELLRNAFDAALSTEKQHEKGMFRPGRLSYPFSATTYARYFVVKWFARHVAKRTTWLEVTKVRPDVMYAQALRECLDGGGKNPFLQPNRLECASWYYPNLEARP